MSRTFTKLPHTIYKKIWITLGLLFLFRILSYIPVPFVNTAILAKAHEQLNFLEFANLFSGGTLKTLTIMLTGVSSYISASILVQFLSYGIQKFSLLSKSTAGQKILKRYTLILAMVISFASSYFLTSLFQNQFQMLTRSDLTAYLVIASCHTLGTVLAVQLGELITKKGFGNGLSLLIVINVLSGFPSMVEHQLHLLETQSTTWVNILFLVVLILLVFGMVVFIDSSELLIPMQYSQAIARGDTGFRNQFSSFPIKLNLNGAMPVILASSFFQMTGVLVDFFHTSSFALWVKGTIIDSAIVYSLVFAGLIFGFSYLYGIIAFDAQDVSDSMQKSGATIVGIRPGEDTVHYLRKTTQSLFMISAFFLSVLSLLPLLVFESLGLSGIAGTSLMIVVGVSLEVILQYRNDCNIHRPIRR